MRASRLRDKTVLMTIWKSGFVLLLMLAGCTNVEGSQTSIVATAGIEFSAPTLISPTLVPTVTSTPEPPCDPFLEDFCITDGHFLLERPIHPPANDIVDPTYRYGSTANGTREPHHGVEFPNPSGTPVHAAAEGRVIFAGSDEKAIFSPWQNFYGNMIVIEHAGDVFTLYNHLSRIDVQSGQNVSSGDKIGEVGWTGVAIGSHLHFEVRHGNVEDYFSTQNPELWLAPAKAEDGNPFGVLLMSVRDENHHLVKHAEYTIQFHADSSQAPVKSYYGTTYSADLLNGEENAVLGDLPAGRYRIAVEQNGQISERWVEVESGKLTQVVFIVK